MTATYRTKQHYIDITSYSDTIHLSPERGCRSLMGIIEHPGPPMSRAPRRGLARNLCMCVFVNNDYKILPIILHETFAPPLHPLFHTTAVVCLRQYLLFLVAASKQACLSLILRCTRCFLRYFNHGHSVKGSAVISF